MLQIVQEFLDLCQQHGESVKTYAPATVSQPRKLPSGNSWTGGVASWPSGSCDSPLSRDAVLVTVSAIFSSIFLDENMVRRIEWLAVMQMAC